MAERSGEKPKPRIKNLVTKAREAAIAARWVDVIDLRTQVLEQVGPEVIESLNDRGRAWRIIANQHRALKEFEAAEAVARATGNKEGLLLSKSNKVDSWRTGGRDRNFPYPEDVITEEQRREYRYQKAFVLAAEAQALVSEMLPNGFSEAIGHAWNNIGLLYDESQNYEGALQVYTDAEAGLRGLLVNNPQDGNLQERVARTVHLKGIALERLGELPEAEAAQRESLDVSLKMDHGTNSINAAVSLGDVLFKSGRKDEGHAYYALAHRIRREKGINIDPTMNKMVDERLARPL